MDVGEQLGPWRGAVSRPGLPALRPVGEEDERVAERVQRVEALRSLQRNGGRDRHGAGFGAVGLPQDARGAEEEGIADYGQLGGMGIPGSRLDVLDESGLAPVRLPQLQTLRAVGTEEHLAVERDELDDVAARLDGGDPVGAAGSAVADPEAGFRVSCPKEEPVPERRGRLVERTPDAGPDGLDEAGPAGRAVGLPEPGLAWRAGVQEEQRSGAAQGQRGGALRARPQIGEEDGAGCRAVALPDSRPAASLSAANTSTPLISASSKGAMSRTRTVPAAVPSVFQSAGPCTPSSARKKRAPPTTVSSLGSEEQMPGQMSRTMTVPASVPSERQSSVPWTPSEVVKKPALPSAADS